MWNSFWRSLDSKSKGGQDFSSLQLSQSYVSHVSLHCQIRDILSLWKGLPVKLCDTDSDTTARSPPTSLAHSPAGLFPLGAFMQFYLDKKEVSGLQTLFPCPGQLAGRAVLGPTFGWARPAAPAGMQRFLCWAGGLGWISGGSSSTHAGIRLGQAGRCFQIPVSSPLNAEEAEWPKNNGIKHLGQRGNLSSLLQLGKQLQRGQIRVR